VSVIDTRESCYRSLLNAEIGLMTQLSRDFARATRLVLQQLRMLHPNVIVLMLQQAFCIGAVSGEAKNRRRHVYFAGANEALEYLEY